MRILIVNSERGVAGGLTAAAELAAGLASAGHQVAVVCHPESELRRRLDLVPGIDVAPVAIRAELNAWRSVEIARILRQRRTDVILADRRKDVKLSFGARLLQPGAALVHRHGAPSPLRDGIVYRSVWSRIDAMIVNSASMKQQLLDRTPWIGRLPIHVIHNGKDLDRYQPRPDVRAGMRRSLGIAEDRFVIVYHGVLQARKNVSAALRAACALPATLRPHALICGDGPDADALRSLTGTAGLAATFTGVRSDIPEVLSAADVAVHLSFAEGFSNSVIESLACGLPVIASDTPSHREQIRDGVTGWLVEGEDAVAKRLETLASDRDCLRSAGAAARQDATARFALPRMVERYDGVLSEAVSSRRRPR